jgi:GTPase SAR1 family protein
MKETYRNQARTYFVNALAVVIVFDITSKFSYDEVDEFLNSINEACPTNVIKVLVGNKRDLEDRRQVSYDTA